MTFIARILRTSPVGVLWTSHNRTGGIVAGVRFMKAQDGSFVSGELHPAQVAAIKDHGSVRLETIGMPLPAVKTEPDLPPDADDSGVDRMTITGKAPRGKRG